MRVSKEMFEKVVDLYFLWKQLNMGMKDLGPRGVNFPDAISEIMVCYAMGFEWNRESSGDATDKNGRLVEIKATSNYDSDLSSFSPNTSFSALYFLRLDRDADVAEIYDMNMDFRSFQKLRVNQKESVEVQQKSGRRPRLSLIKVIEREGIKPKCRIDIEAKSVDLW